MAKHLDFIYNDVEYRLEFNRNTCVQCNIPFKELEELEATPEKSLVIIPKLWRYSFLMHHSDVSEEIIDEIYENMCEKDGKLPEALVLMYVEPLEALFKKQGNVKWKKSW